MRKLKLFLSLLMVMLLSVGNVWAVDYELVYTLDGSVTTGGNSNYAQDGGGLTQDGVDWSVTGNTAINPWRIGGKNLSGVDRLAYSKTAIADNIAKIEIEHGTATLTVNSIKVEVASDAAFSNIISTFNESYSSKVTTITELRPDGKDWTGRYYRITYNVTAGGSNSYVQLKSVKFYKEKSASDPVLESITISGDLSNKSYEEGQSLDFTGLTATGHYNNSSTADLTDDVEWSFAPALTKGLTSVTVTATLNEISGNKVISNLIVAAAPAAVEYALFSGELEEGDYVIYYNGYALKNTIANERLQYTEVTPSDNKITNPNASIVWHIAQSGSYWTIYNAAVAKYAAGTGAKNKAQLLADGTDNKSLWTASGDETYDFVNKANDAAGVNKTLRNNGTYGFACYATGTGGPLSLYKKVDDQVAVVKPAILGDTYFLTSSEVSMTCTTDGAEIHYTLDGSDPTATSTLYENPFTLTATTTVKAIAVKGTDVSAIAEKEFTKATVKTVAEALAMSATDDVYVIGYISAITEVSTEHKNATYRISDDGTKTGEMIVYRGKYLNNADFTEENKNNIHVGDKVVVRGGLVEYQNAMQLATGNYLISIEYPEVAIPTFEPAVESFLESVEVSLACSTDGAEIRYTLDGTDPTATSTLYKDPFTLTETKTVKAIAIKGGTTTNVVSKTYTKQEIMTVAEALASSAANGVYVKGIISTITEVSTSFKNATYRISDNGTKTDEMIVYRGRYINNTDFTSEDQIELGDEVVVYGNLVAYQNAMQLATGNYLISLVRKQPAGLAWNPAEDIEITVGDAFTAPSLTNPHGLTVTIASDNTELATVENGVVSLVADATGTAKITATFAGDDTYKAAEVSYTVTVSAAAPVLTDYYEKVTETAGIVEGTYLIVYEDASVAFNGGLETLDDTENTIDVAITNDNKIGVTSTTAASTFYIDPTAGTVQAKSGKYIGVSSNSNGLKTSDDATTYTHTFSIDESGDAVIATAFEGSTMSLRYNTANNQLRFRYYKDNGQQAIQLYKLHGETVKANPELAWDKESIELTVGGMFTSPTLDNPHSVEGIIYSSDNEALATVTNAGVIELEENATGTAHITASFAGNDDYKAASVSCTIIVNASAPTPLPIAEAKVIVVEYNSKFYAMSTTVKNGTGFEPIEVAKEGDKIIVKSDEEAAAIQWQIALGAEAATFQNGDSKYLACSTESNTGLALLDDASVWAWDADAKCYKQQGKDEKDRTFYYNYNTGNPIFRAYLLTTIGGENYSGVPEFIGADQIEVQVPTPKIDPELAFDPTEVELTLGETFTAPTLGHVVGFNGTITYSSSKPAVATVDESTGEVTIVANGTTTITASFEGNDDYEEDEASYTITVNKPAPTPTSTVYRKVTATADITDGEYLIVYEGDATHDAVVFDGSLENVDQAMKALAVEIASDEIAGNTDLDAAVFTIDVTAGSLQSASGLYIGRTVNSNGMDKSTTEAYVNTFAITDGAAVITSAGGPTLRYNYASDQLRFRYYKSGQQAIQLYKKVVVEPEWETVRENLEANRYYTVCLPKKMMEVRGASFWTLSSRNEAGSMAYLEEVDPTTAEAGTPFIIQATDTKLEVVYTGAATTTAGTNGALRGTLNGIDAEAFAALPGNPYLLINNAIRPRTTGNFLAANRAYIEYSALEVNTPQPAPGRRVRAVPMQQNTATGIDELNGSEAPAKVLINGQLFILRGEKMYDAKGQLVK